MMYAVVLALSAGAMLAVQPVSPAPTPRAVPAAQAAADTTSKIHPALYRVLEGRPGPVKAWVFFTDKGMGSARELAAALADLEATYPPRAVERRMARRTDPGLFDARDLPVAARDIDAVRGTGVEVHVTSRWLNAVSVTADAAGLEAIARLGRVRVLQPVRFGPRSDVGEVSMPAGPFGGGGGTRGGFYGRAEAQLAQIDLIAVHTQGHTGDGVVVGILDTGFQRTHAAFNAPGHPLVVVAEHDFVDDDGNTAIEPGDHPDQHEHGTLILGTLGAYLPDELVGGAYDASYILCKTEDITSETPVEEDNYVGGLEFIELHGGDVATASLIYIDWYTQEDLDGMTAVTTIGVNIATANGVHCCNAAGNAGHDANPATSSLGAPADALQVITCGAAGLDGGIAGFSSDGPTADGRLKPEVLACGLGTDTVSPNNTTGFTTASGTSLSTPLVAGAVACLTGARPTWTVDQLRAFLFTTADDFVANGMPDPLFVRGYGVINAAAALALDCNANGVPDPQDISSGTSNDVNANGVPDECEGCLPDFTGDGIVNIADFLAFLSAYAGGEPRADFNGDGTTNVQDFLAFLSAFAAGC